MSNTFFGFFRGRSNSLLAIVSRSDEPNRLTNKPFRISIFRAAQMFQTATSIARAAKARGGFPPGLAMACSLKDSLQGSRVFNRPHPTLRTSFPLPIPGRPNGHREAPSLQCNFQRIAQASFVRNPRSLFLLAPCCSFLRIAMTRL